MAMGMKANPEDYEVLPLWKLHERFEFYASYVERHNQMVKQMQSKR